MKILNTTTGQEEQLNHNGYECDCVPDLIANDSSIKWDENKEVWEGDEKSIDWWRDYLAADEAFMEAKAELVETLDYEEKEELELLLHEATWCDMGDQPAAGLLIIDEWISQSTKIN